MARSEEEMTEANLILSLRAVRCGAPFGLQGDGVFVGTVNHTLGFGLCCVLYVCLWIMFDSSQSGYNRVISKVSSPL
jgi:hypothetical protein